MISHLILLNMRNVSTKFVHTKHTLHLQYFVSKNCAICEVMLKNNVQPDWSQITIWHTHIACWITKATDTYSEFLILIASPLQRWLSETHLNVTLYVSCLSCINIMLLSTSWSSKWSHVFRSPNQKATYISLPPHTCHILETQIIYAGSTNL
jgi:hypothetical protein